jgi:hypothetical protein
VRIGPDEALAILIAKDLKWCDNQWSLIMVPLFQAILLLLSHYEMSRQIWVGDDQILSKIMMIQAHNYDILRRNERY